MRYTRRWAVGYEVTGRHRWQQDSGLTRPILHAIMDMNVTEVRNGIRVDRLEESGKAPEFRL